MKAIISENGFWTIENGLEDVSRMYGVSREDVRSAFEDAGAVIEYDDLSGLSADDGDVAERWMEGFPFASAWPFFENERGVEEALNAVKEVSLR